MTGEINTNSDPDPYDDELELGRATAVPVKIIGKPNVTLAPEFGGANTWPIPNSNGSSGQTYTQIGQRRPTRHRLRIWIPSISGSGQTDIGESNPAIGSSFVWTNTTGSPVNLLTLRGFLTTDAVVANRFVQVQIKDASNNILVAAQDTLAVVASSTIAINAYQGAAQTNSASGFAGIPLPLNLTVPINGTVTLNIVNMDPGDQLSQVVIAYSSNGVGQVRISADLPSLINGGGVTIPAAIIPFGDMTWDSEKPCYATCDGGTATIFTLDESYLEKGGQAV